MFDYSRHERIKAKHDDAMAVAKRLQEQSILLVHHSARAKCRTEWDLLRIDYSGVICDSAVQGLRRQMLPLRMATNGAIEDLTGALTLSGAAFDTDLWTPQTPPSAVIVRPDQYARSQEFCALLARCGVARTCWLPHRLSDAKSWLEQVLE